MTPYNVLSVTNRPQILIVDFGSQYTLKIESSLREIGYRSAILGPERAAKWLENNPVMATILSGGPNSVNDPEAPIIPEAIFKAGVPILAICYGMQAVAKQFGGTVESVEVNRGYSREQVLLQPSAVAADMALFTHLPKELNVWASHGDSVTTAPPGFQTIAINEKTNSISAMIGINNGKPIYCVQFHPEVSHTEYGKTMLRNFVTEVCGCESDWKTGAIVRTIRSKAARDINGRHAVMGFSGGVDSTTLARILAPALGERLHCIVIDGGQLRENEMEEIQRHAIAAGVALTIVDAKKRFERAFGKTTDAEKVRKIFRAHYASILRKEARRIGHGDLSRTVLIQGTLAPDRIESGATGGALIKTHHNVNLDTGELAQLHPLGDLFKYEVRALARRLKLPKSVSERQPFPGPGLFIRLPGMSKTPENLEIVRWVDARTREILERYGWYNRVSQLVPTYGFHPTVGVKGDARVYKPVAVVRAVKTIDFMTAKGVIFPRSVMEELVLKLTQHKEVSRVFFDPTPKPPGTTEME